MALNIYIKRIEFYIFLVKPMLHMENYLNNNVSTKAILFRVINYGKGFNWTF
jgi:hypothetical protein